MKNCTFFGHRDCTIQIRPKLMDLLKILIREQDIGIFYVGNRGNFDMLVIDCLRELVKTNPAIKYNIVLSKMPVKGERDFSDTIFPEELEGVYPKYAIDYRNRWMLKRSDVVVTYVRHPWGGAAKFSEMAKRLGKEVINLYEGESTILLQNFTKN